MGNNWPAFVLEPGNIAATQRTSARAAAPVRAPGFDLDCLIEYRGEDLSTGVQFRDCLIDYTRCPNALCIKKLL